jgi:predicted DNA-binding protein
MLLCSGKKLHAAMPTKDPVLSVRLPDDLSARLDACAEKLDLSKNDVARHAIRAAVESIEANDFRISLPLQMAVAAEPVVSVPQKKSKPHPLEEAVRGQAKPAYNTEAASAPAYVNESPTGAPSKPAHTPPPRATGTRQAIRRMIKKEAKNK